MTTHSSILAWRIPWTETSSRLQSMGLDATEQLTHTQFNENDRTFILCRPRDVEVPLRSPGHLCIPQKEQF